MSFINRSSSLAIGFCLLLTIGCSSPWQGAGSLYLSEKGEIKCISVDSVTFYTNRYNTYKVSGREYVAQVVLEYYPGQKCN